MAKKGPPKVQSFLWLAVQNRLCTKDFLLFRNIIPVDRAFCIFCENEIEIQIIFSSIVDQCGNYG